MNFYTCSAVVAITVATACVATPAAAQTTSFNLKAQDAATGVPAFALQAGVQIVVSTDALRGKRTRAVKGAMRIDQALQQLLRGTGLRVASRQGQTVTLIAEKAEPKPPARSAPERPVVETAAQADRGVETEAVNDIIVTGVKSRLSEAPQDVKQRNIGFVNSVGAVEIAERTDVSVADAILRLPGVARSRGFQTSGSWYVAIRGFDGQYSSVNLDGGMLYNSTRNQRAVYLDLIPAASINQITVAKTVTPEMDPNSIGGHVIITTVRSFDNDGEPVTKFDAQGNFYVQGGAPDEKFPSGIFNGVIKRTFGADDNFGFVLAGSLQRERFNEKFNNTVGFVQPNGIDIPSGNLATGNFDRRIRSENALGKLEGRGDNWYGFVAASYFHHFTEADLYRSNVSIVPSLVTNAADRSGDFTGATVQAFSNLHRLERTVGSLTTGGEFQVNDTSKFVINASTLRARYGEEFWSGGNFTLPGVSGSYNLTDDAALTTLNPVAGLSDPAAFIQRSGTTANQTLFPMTDNIYTGRIQYKSNNFEFSRGLGFDLGVDWRRLDRVLDQTGLNYALPAGATIPLSDVLIPGTNFNGANTSQAVFIDRNRYWDTVTSRGTLSVNQALTTDYTLTEDVFGAFASLYYTSDNFRMIAGARYNLTRFDSSSGRIVNGVLEPFENSRSIPFFLPNIQGYYDFENGLRIRAAFTVTTALVNFNSFAQGQATNFNFIGLPVTTGSNPDLDPRRSYNKDVAIEFYRPEGYISLGYFHKTIKDEVFNVVQSIRDANGVLLQTLTSPLNGGGANSQGIELEAQWRDFTAIAPWLSGLSVDANFAVFDSNLDVILSDGTSREINGFFLQPKYIANFILNYDNGPFSANLLATARGRAFLNFALNQNADSYIAPHAALDLRVAYEIQNNVRLFADARNITDSVWREQTGSTQDQLGSAIQPGRSFVLGASVSF